MRSIAEGAACSLPVMDITLPPRSVLFVSHRARRFITLGVLAALVVGGVVAALINR